MKPIEKAIKILNGQTELAKKLGVTKQAVNAWAHEVKEIPPYRAIQIERLTNGQVTIDDLINITSTQENI